MAVHATDRSARGPYALLGAGVAAFLAALAIRLTGIDSRDVWLDEIYTQFAASRDWLALVDDRVSRGHSPFYFALLKLSGVDPANIAGVRALSAVFDAGAAAVLAAGSLRYFGARTALLVAALYVLSPLHIHWAQNARPYGLLMLFTAMGLIGAVGLTGSVGQTWDDTEMRGAHLLFAFGWGGASLTMTGGILAYLVVLSLPWWPGLRKGVLADPDFRRRWIRAQKWPSIVAFFVYMLVSRVHVVDRIGNYWLESRRPFGAESLRLLVEEVSAGEVGQAAQSMPGLAPGIAFGLGLLTIAAVVVCAVAGVARHWPQPLRLPILALGFGVLGLMLAMSLNTSLLTGRYFTPPWMGLLVGAGVGLAGLRGTPRLAIAAPLLGVMAAFAYGAATGTSQTRTDPPGDIAALIDAAPSRHAPIVVDRSIFRELRMELMLLRLDESRLPRPAMDGAEAGEEARRLAEAGEAFFVVVTPGDWERSYAADHGTRACLARVAGWVVAFVAERGPADCAEPFAPAPAPSGG